MSPGDPSAAPPPPPPQTLPAFTLATWTSPNLDGTVQAQPLYVSSANVVVVVTENDSVYGLNPATGAIVWGPTSIGTPEPLAENDGAGPLMTLNGCGDIDPIGITSNPVLAGGHVFVVGERETATLANGHHLPEHVIASIDPSTGAIAQGPMNIDPPAMTVATPDSTQNQITGEQQRTGLVAANGQIYVGFGGLAGDCGPYHGFLVGVKQADLTIASTFESATSAAIHLDREGAVWAPGGVAANSAGTLIYAATGNSQDVSTPTPANEDFSDAVVQLDASSLSPPIRVFQPSTFIADNQSDADLGSSAPALVDNGAQLFQIGKRGIGYLLDSFSLALDGQLSLCSGGSYGSVATFANAIYVPCRGSGMKQLVLGNGTMVAGWTSPPNVPAGGPATVDPSTNMVFSADTGTEQLFGVNAITGQDMMRYQLALTNQEHFPTPGLGDNEVFIESGLTIKAFPT